MKMYMMLSAIQILGFAHIVMSTRHQLRQNRMQGPEGRVQIDDRVGDEMTDQAPSEDTNDSIRPQMDTRPLRLQEGQEQSVTCSVNRDPIFFFQPPFPQVSFVHVPNGCSSRTSSSSPPVPGCEPRVLSTNGMNVDADPALYGSGVTGPPGHTTVFTLVYKNPGMGDRGQLSCQLVKEGETTSLSRRVIVPRVPPTRSP